MAEKRTHYERFLEEAGNWQGSEGLLEKLLNSRDPEGQSSARKAAREIYAKSQGIDPARVRSDIPDERLRDGIEAVKKEAESAAIKYFKDNYHPIIDSLPRDKLEESVIDGMPQLGLGPIESDGMSRDYNETVKLHRAYLGQKDIVERFVKGEGKTIENDKIRQIVADRLVRKKIKELEEKGVDGEREPLTYELAEQAARQLAYQLDSQGLAEQAMKNLGEVREIVENQIKERYVSFGDYAKEIIDVNAEKDIRNTARGISYISKL